MEPRDVTRQLGPRRTMNDLTVRGLVLIALTLGALGGSAIGIASWARTTGRRPWLWVLGAFAVNIGWIGICALMFTLAWSRWLR